MTLIKSLLRILILIAVNEAVSILAYRILRLQAMPLPFDWVIIVNQGFYGTVLFAWCIVLLMSMIIVLFYQGGLQRVIANYLLIAIFSILAIFALSLIAFHAWSGIAMHGSLWHIFEMLRSLDNDKEAIAQLLFCFLKFSQLETAKKSFGNAHFASNFEIYRSRLFSKQGIILGKAHGAVLRLAGHESVLVCAPTGSGKTSAIAIPNLLTWQGSGIFNDLKGELFKFTAKHRQQKLGQKIVCFVPSNSDMQTDGYNPFFYVSNDLNLIVRDLQLIAEILIPSERIDGGFWYTSARDLFILLAVYLIETKSTATLAEIHDLSKQENFFEWLLVETKEGTIKNQLFYQNAYSLLNADAEKTQKNILKDFHSRMALFSDPLVRNATSKNTFDLRKLRQEKISIYLIVPDSDKERLKSLLTLFWAQCIHLLSQKEPNLQEEPYSILALLDEFGNMARINKLKEGMSFLRSYHVRAIVIVQYLSQIISVYGQHDAKGFLNTKVKIAFALNDIDDARFFSASLGSKTVKVISLSSSIGERSSTSKNYSFQTRPLMIADEIMQMKKDDEIILIEAAMPVRAKKCWGLKKYF